MKLFTKIWNKITGHSTADAAPASAQPAATLAAVLPPPAAATSSQAPATSTASPASAPPVVVVDVAAVLDDLAKKNPEKLDWKKSIVDLMKLVGMDSSLASRKELAAELAYSGDTSDSAKMNIWLHKEVLKQLAANGGKVPENLLD